MMVLHPLAVCDCAEPRSLWSLWVFPGRTKTHALLAAAVILHGQKRDFSFSGLIGWKFNFLAEKVRAGPSHAKAINPPQTNPSPWSYSNQSPGITMTNQSVCVFVCVCACVRAFESVSLRELLVCLHCVSMQCCPGWALEHNAGTCQFSVCGHTKAGVTVFHICALMWFTPCLSLPAPSESSVIPCLRAGTAQWATTWPFNRSEGKACSVTT